MSQCLTLTIVFIVIHIKKIFTKYSVCYATLSIKIQCFVDHFTI